MSKSAPCRAGLPFIRTVGSKTSIFVVSSGDGVLLLFFSILLLLLFVVIFFGEPSLELPGLDRIHWSSFSVFANSSIVSDSRNFISFGVTFLDTNGFTDLVSPWSLFSGLVSLGDFFNRASLGGVSFNIGTVTEIRALSSLLCL